MQKVCTNDFITQKIRSLNVMAKLLEKKTEILKKDFVYPDLEKKELKEL